MNFEEEIKKVLKDGEIAIGRKKVKKGLVMGGVKMVVVTSSAPVEMMEDIKRYSKLSGIPYYVFQGDAKELGYACAKPFPISTFAIVKEGSSKILSLAKKQ
jgi:large subunit ribosomal protein L30e